MASDKYKIWKEIKVMKRMKKIVSILLAMAMVVGMSLTVFAADNNQHKITVTQNVDDKTEHTYEAYQIFAGDLATVGGQQILSNIIWGKGVNEDALLAALQVDATFNVADEEGNKTNIFADCSTAAEVAKVLSGEEFGNSTVSKSTLTDAFARVVENNLTTTVAGTATGKGNVEITVTGSGYYLVKDKNGSVDTANGAYSRFMLQVVGDATATVKSEVPSGDKKVYIGDVTTGDVTTGDANNASIGSHVSYKITSKVPNHVGYNYYYFIMNDTLSEGLTFDGVGSVAVKVGDDTLKQGVIDEDGKITEEGDYYVYTGTTVAPKTFRLAFANIMNYAVGANIVVTYSATVNDKAVVGTTGNPNTWNLQYSNNPDDTFDGERPDGENTPGLPADEENEALGQTPDEKTLTYVTELDITKYANSVEDHLLAGAEFTLTGISKQVVLNTVDYYEAAENGTYYLLLDGTYTETPPTGTAYVEIGVGTKDTTTGYIKDENGGYVVPTDKTAYEGQTLYKLVKGTAEKYADVNTKYVKKTATKTTYVNADVSIEMTTGEDGKISFKDLGAGEYILTETVTPEGFNTLEPIKIVITFEGPKSVNDGKETCTWKMTWNGEEIKGTNGIFAQNVINQSGSLLPSTGGIGTTIFYVVGGILVIGAGILLVAKKRMSNR